MQHRRFRNSHSQRVSIRSSNPGKVDRSVIIFRSQRISVKWFARNVVTCCRGNIQVSAENNKQSYATIAGRRDQVTFLFVVATILILLISFALSQLSVGCMGAALGGIVEEVSVGAGPTLWFCTVRGIKLKFGAIPIGGYTRFLNQEALQKGETEEGIPVSREEGIPFEELPIGSRFITIGLGPLSFLCIGVIFFAIAQTLPHSDVVVSSQSNFPIRPTAVPGLSVIPRHADAISQAQLVLNTSLEFFWRVITLQSLQGWGGILGMIVTCSGAGVLATGAWYSCMGAVIFGFGLINLLPLPGYSGGNLLFLLCEALGKKPSERTFTIGVYASLIFFVILAGRIVYADIMWLGQ